MDDGGFYRRETAEDTIIEERAPEHSPWGRVQDCRHLADGIEAVSTSTHGGIWLSEDRLEELHEILPFNLFTPFTREPQWWEEDCDWTIPAIVFAAEIDDPTMAEQATRKLSDMAKIYGGKYLRAWEALR